MPGIFIEIVIQNTYTDDWTAWFEGLQIEPAGPTLTRLSGQINDQAALHGLLGRIRDLNLYLVSVQVSPL